MLLSSLAINDFRNIRSIIMKPGKTFNLLYGLNGQGKTNLLEAIYLLGSSRSFRSSRLHELVTHGEKRSCIRGIIESGGIESQLQLFIEPPGRRMDIDGKAVHKASELHGRLNPVLFSPDDTSMARGGPDSRRRYLDRAVYMGDVGYLHCWHSYQRILKQRNQLLKSRERSGLDVWTESLAETGAEIIERRLMFVSRLDMKLGQYYSAIAGSGERASITYNPCGIGTLGREEKGAALLELFRRHQKTDELYGSTSVGPHRDDLTFLLDDRTLKAFGSHGQQKSFVLALKMAEMDHLRDIYGVSPLLLLDDMSSELDARRNANLMDFLTKRDIQVFITTTEKSPALLEAVGECAVFRVEEGYLTFEGN